MVQLKCCPCHGKLMGYFCLRKLFSAKVLVSNILHVRHCSLHLFIGFLKNWEGVLKRLYG